MRGRFTEKENEQLEQLIEAGWSGPQIARALDRRTSSVWGRMLRTGRSPKTARRPVTMPLERRVQMLTEAGISAKVIAALVRRPKGSIDMIRWRRGFHPPAFPHRLNFSVTDHAHRTLESSGRRNDLSASVMARTAIELLTRDRAETAAAVVLPPKPAPAPSIFAQMQPQLVARL
jgi:hypothetical protein